MTLCLYLKFAKKETRGFFGENSFSQKIDTGTSGEKKTPVVDTKTSHDKLFGFLYAIQLCPREIILLHVDIQV